MNRPWLKTLLLGAAEILVLLILYQVVLQEVIKKDVVSVILSTGDHVPRSTLLLAGLFLGLRALVIWALPGMVMVRLGLAVFDFFWPAGRRNTPTDPNIPS